MEPTSQNFNDSNDTDHGAESTGQPNVVPVTPQPRHDEKPHALPLPESLGEPHHIPWTPVDYALLGILGESARKLHDSAVAPIVAAARGYSQLQADNRNVARRKYGLSSWSTRQGRRLGEALKNGDALIMPWYRLDNALSHQKNNVSELQISTVQYRPERPQMMVDEKTGKSREAKYEFVVGEDSILGLHPSTPFEWSLPDEQGNIVADRWIIAEGMLKADSMISAMLLASNNIDNDELLLTSEDSGIAATRRLTTMMARLERDLRIPILCVAGVYNWTQNSEWNALNLKDKEVWIAFDADMDTNANVWKAAQRLREYLIDKKKADKSRLQFLSPNVVSGDGGEMSKMGVDDYLSKIGNWQSLLGFLTTKMPDFPADDDWGMVGLWRVDKDGSSVSECVETKDVTGQVTGQNWIRRVGLGGRIAELSKRRTPSTEEIETGILGEGINEHDASLETEVRIEVQWNEGSEVKTATIVGPDTILNYAPEQWDRHGAKIPSDVLMHPEWPPPRGKSTNQSWLGAIKSHRAEERSEPTVWRRMGWVPVGGVGTTPSFVVGDQVISHKSSDTITAPGISEEDLPRALNFGVGKHIEFPEQSFEDTPENAEYRAMVDADLRAVLDHMVTRKPWTDPGVAAAVLCSALRPVIPERPKGTLFIVGPPGKGKSFTAGVLMGFWARRPGVWKSDDLPGSASDTAAAIELAMSRAPVWVIDDYHPSRDGREASGMEDKINAAVRRQFNNSVRRRSNAHMGGVAVHSPNTSLVVTGENELSVNSIKQRLIEIPLRAGALNESRDVTSELEALSEHAGVPARLTQHLIRYIQYVSEVEGSWKALVERVTEDIAYGENTLIELMEHDIVASKKRSAELFADYFVVLQWLDSMARTLGWSSGERKIFKMGENGLGLHLAKMIRTQNTDMARETPGASLIQAISDLLSGNHAHIVNLADPSSPPAEADYGGTDLALRLGWMVSGNSDNPLRPSGAKIGYLTTRASDQQPILILDARNAFAEAQRHYPSLIPAGQTSKSSWQSVKDEGFIDWEGLPAPRSSYTTRLQVKGANSEARTGVTGVPILLETVLGSSSQSAEEDLSDPTR